MMIDIQTAIGSLVELLTDGGSNAAKELFKGVMINGVNHLSDAWRQIFAESPEAFPLAHQVAQDSTNQIAMEKLTALLEKVLKQNPELLQEISKPVNINSGDGGVAAGVISGSVISIENNSQSD